MLQDKDRIFTNLYGQFDPFLKGARARGDWDNTAAILARGRDALVQEMKDSGTARARRGRIPHRPEVVVHAEAIGSAVLSGRERGRIGARHVQGPRHHPARSAQACGRMPGRRFRDGRDRGVHLHSRRVLQRVAGAAACDRRGLRGRIDRQERLRFRLRLRCVPASRRRRVYLRRRDGFAGEPRRQEGHAADEAAVPGRRRVIWLPVHGEQCRNPSRWRRRFSAVVRPGSPVSAGRTIRDRKYFAFPAT